MALDGIFLSRVKAEIEAVAVGARVDKIAQPSREEIILHLRWRGGSGKLLLAASPQSPRVHWVQDAPENPKAPPMFCMLLRKHLMGGKLAEIKQVSLDRILQFKFESTNELGDPVDIFVVIEIMGKHSNIILVGQDNRIIDAIKRVNAETSSVRQVLPGMHYALPPAQDKLNLLEAGPAEIIQRLRIGKDIEFSKALCDTLEGTSPIVGREIAHYTTRGEERAVSEITAEQWTRLEFFLSDMIQKCKSGECVPTMVLEPEGRPRDFSYIPIRQYGTAMLTREYESCCALLDTFYAQRDRTERVRQRSGDLLKLIANTSDRIARKLQNQREELKECAKREELKIKGDLISANLYVLQKGDSKAIVQNFYDENGGMVEIELDMLLTPAQNAQRYYSLYRKADTAEKMLQKLIVQGEEEFAYIDTVFDALTRASGEAELEALRQELAAEGYIRRSKAAKHKREEKLPPLKYRSVDGFTILTGRNNLQNDKLTLKDSNNTDIWLHTQKIPGSHTVIVTEGREVPKTTLEQAGIIAAYNSKARESAKVPVDFTLVRYVKKPAGAKPGKVIYDKFETIIVTPNEELVRSLQVK